MGMDRREFTALFAGAIAGLAIPTDLAALGRHDSPLDRLFHRGACSRRASYFEFQAVSDRVHAIIGGGGNSILFRGSSTAMLADSKNPGMGRTIRREAEAQGLPIAHFVNTHHHSDHSGGNDAFAEVHTVAHEAAAARIASSGEATLTQAVSVANRLLEQLRSEGGDAAVIADLEATTAEAAGTAPAAFAPSQTHAGEMTMHVDSDVAEFRWVSAGHTDGDTFIYIPSQNVLHAGDLIFNGRHPYVDVPGGSTPHGWLTCLDAMAARCDADTVVVPGHGAVGGRELIAEQKAYFERLMALVGAAIRDGRTREEVIAIAPDDLTSLASAAGHLPRNLGVVFDEMSR